ncbi:Cytochrome P450 [Drechmeria coniospora]|uniref:Cytochrome P450 n=1 Tax=Drechmeria coniospora TaxID=98403 RepID=A0A151GVH0_DRECN|nr:Cytochrome P450 [Drechmeria coniospora]KYK61105.1 Cytochrome P450 [Drechmeria coniospora]
MASLTLINIDQKSKWLKQEPSSSLTPLLVLASGAMLLLSSIAQVWNRIVDFLRDFGRPVIQNVPQVPGYPILGVLPQMCNEGLYSATMREMFDAAKDSGISCSSVGTVPIVLLRDPGVIRQVLVQNSDSITRFAPDGTGPFGIMQRITGDIAASANGQDWHRWRKGFLKDFSNSTALRKSYGDILRIAKHHVEKMKTEKSGTDLLDAMQAYALDSVWSVTLGADNISQSADEILSVMSRYGDIVGSPSHLWRHHIRNFVSGKAYREPDYIEKSVGDQINGVLDKLLGSHIENVNPEEHPGEDLKHNFLRRTSKESGGSLQSPITEDVLSQARQVFSLGHEAPTLVLSWAIYELGRHPEVIEKLRREIQDSKGDDGDLDFETLRGLPYLDSVCLELLRLHSPISATSRMVTKPIVLETKDKNTVVLPPGTHLFASVHLLHHDKLVWGENADEFVPERWTGLKPSILESRCEYLPFLAGPRGCPSASFVSVQMKTMLSVLLSQVDVELTDSTGVEKCIGGVVRPSKPLPYQIHEICV